ncbi:uncharacterized protein METZ01_LOCUS350760 [marine metagenome]|uniref:Uncharacterized protein n=1 Tax=marine metagenome TaxID=408172 RepID=A0A382RJU8_9ZZZZ
MHAEDSVGLVKLTEQDLTADTELALAA